MSHNIEKGLLWVAAPLTLIVIVAGAFTRLSDAGLGCPDWPGCYGQLIGAPDASVAAAHSPAALFDSKKAWIEVTHRYIAAALGLLIAAAAILSARRSLSAALFRPPVWLAVLVIFQALLGMLTVTDKLRPIIVSAHLLGGIFIFTVIAYALTTQYLRHPASGYLRTMFAVTAMIITLQIFLGGWVSTNYAALSCPDFPLCHGQWLPPKVEWEGFVLSRELHLDSTGAPISAAALTTIHWIHRTVAALVVLCVIGLGLLLLRAGAISSAVILWMLVILQVMLGIINVLKGLPLWSALAHNVVAAILAATMGVIMAKIIRK